MWISSITLPNGWVYFWGYLWQQLLHILQCYILPRSLRSKSPPGLGMTSHSWQGQVRHGAGWRWSKRMEIKNSCGSAPEHVWLPAGTLMATNPKGVPLVKLQPGWMPWKRSFRKDVPQHHLVCQRPMWIQTHFLPQTPSGLGNIFWTDPAHMAILSSQCCLLHSWYRLVVNPLSRWGIST